MTQPEWSARLVRVIADQIRWHRKRKRPKMSAQALADRCAELGWPIKRSVLANLEAGRRETITVPELFVIAAALEVPPVDLLVPLGRVDQVEALPDVSWRPEVVVDWLTGRMAPAGGQWADNIVSLFRRHLYHKRGWGNTKASVRVFQDQGYEKRAEKEEARATYHLSQLLLVRREMRDRGLTPPASEELAVAEELAGAEE